MATPLPANEGSTPGMGLWFSPGLQILTRNGRCSHQRCNYLIFGGMLPTQPWHFTIQTGCMHVDQVTVPVSRWHCVDFHRIHLLSHCVAILPLLAALIHYQVATVPFCCFSLEIGNLWKNLIFWGFFLGLILTSELILCQWCILGHLTAKHK